MTAGVVPMKEKRVHWVETAAELDRLGRRLARVDEFGLDTEQDSFYAYRSKVCVAQIAADGEEWIVDVLALDDFGPLEEPFANPGVTTVMHAGENDVDLLRRGCGLDIRGLFDTMAAAQVLGYRRTGLAGLIDEHFDVVVEKKFQRSDWRVRPLKREQIEYAALDVRYLSRLREILEDELLDLGRMEEAEAEFHRIERVVHKTRRFQADDYIRIRGADELDGHGRYALKELFILRNSIGKAEDRAVFRVCGDPVLVELARRLPREARELRSIRGLSDRVVKRHGARILEILGEARDQEVARPDGRRRKARRQPSSSGLSRPEKRLLDKLREWRRRVAEERDVEEGRVVPTALLVKLIQVQPRNRKDLKRAGLEVWRIKEYGDELLRELRPRGRG